MVRWDRGTQGCDTQTRDLLAAMDQGARVVTDQLRNISPIAALLIFIIGLEEVGLENVS